MAGVRFEDVDLLGALSRIVDLHTQHYKEDFDLDKELISKLAVSDRSEDKQLLWMSRPCGTYTLREREVYLDGSHENKVWRFYQEQTNDPVLAYAISLKEVRDGKIFGKGFYIWLSRFGGAHRQPRSFSAIITSLIGIKLRR